MPGVPSFETRALAGTCWRLVEAQHVIATMKLTDTLDEQQILEDLIEASKPPMPVECRELDYLLSAPFRYRPYPHGSRFRRANQVEGVYYAAEAVETAVAEVAFYRLLFFAESPGTPWPENPAEYTAFSARFAVDRAIDLTAMPYAEQARFGAFRPSTVRARPSPMRRGPTAWRRSATHRCVIRAGAPIWRS